MKKKRKQTEAQRILNNLSDKQIERFLGITYGESVELTAEDCSQNVIDLCKHSQDYTNDELIEMADRFYRTFQ